MGEDLCDQSYRAQAVWLWPLIHPSASTQDQKSKQVWGQMSSQEILNADLWLAKTILILKAACGCFFLIKTTHPPVSTHHFVSHQSCCLYHYHTAAPKSQLCPGEIEISTRWNLHLSSSPHLKLLLWYRLIWGLQEGQESSLSLLLQPGWCWWPHTSAAPRCESFSSSNLTSTAQVLSSEQPLMQQWLTPGGTSTWGTLGTLTWWCSKTHSLLRLLLCSVRWHSPRFGTAPAGFEVTILTKSSLAPS